MLTIKETFDAKRPDYSPNRAAQLVHDLAFKIKPDKRLNADQRILMEQAIITHFLIDGLRVQVYDWNPSGQKKAILVHGFGGKCLDFYALIPTLMQHNYHVIGFDAPSHGFSEGNEADIGVFWPCIAKIAKECGDHFDLGITHSFGSAALTYQMHLQNIQIKNLVMFSPNAVYDSVLLNFLRQLSANLNVYPSLCDLIVKRFSTRVNQIELWSACSPVENISQLSLKSTPKHCLILHGTKDTMFPPEESYKVSRACNMMHRKLHILECGHREILSEEQTLIIFREFCKQLGVVGIAAAISKNSALNQMAPLYINNDIEAEKTGVTPIRSML